MSQVLKKAADVAHKTVVCGLFTTFAWQSYQVTSNALNHNNGVQEEHPQEGFIQMLKDKAAEEYAKYYRTDHREWYDKDDNSYLKQIPKPEEYAPKKK